MTRGAAAGAVDVPLEYVRLGLRFDRLEAGFVDAYTGEKRIRAEVESEPAPTPQGLRDQARALLRELDAADLPEDRTAFLRGQLTGLECSARKMSGEPVGFVEEVRSYFQVDAELGDPEAYAGALAELDALLPGSGSLAEHASRGTTLDELIGVLDVEHIAEHLYTRGQPDPDLVIRTSGEQRLSGFLLWQTAHSEFHFTDVYWPDFRRVDFLRALRAYAARHRRFGG